MEQRRKDVISEILPNGKRIPSGGEKDNSR